MTKKIVITGIGATSPLGGTAPDSWNALLAGESGAHTSSTTGSTKYELPVTFAATARSARRRCSSGRGQAPRPVEPVRPHRRARGLGRRRRPRGRPERLGVDLATGIGGVWTLLDAWDTLRERAPPRPADDRADAHAQRPGAAVGMDLHARAGIPAPSSPPARRAPRRSSTPTSTCSRARRRRHRRRLRGGHPPDHDRRVRLDAGALAPQRRPGDASRPYDLARDGFVMGEGAAALVARDRGARQGPRRPDLRRARRRRSRATRTTSPRPTPRAPVRHRAR